jgi:hypothetical protein
MRWAGHETYMGGKNTRVWLAKTEETTVETDLVHGVGE